MERKYSLNETEELASLAQKAEEASRMFTFAFWASTGAIAAVALEIIYLRKKIFTGDLSYLAGSKGTALIVSLIISSCMVIFERVALRDKIKAHAALSMFLLMRANKPPDKKI